MTNTKSAVDLVHKPLQTSTTPYAHIRGDRSEARSPEANFHFYSRNMTLDKEEDTQNKTEEFSLEDSPTVKTPYMYRHLKYKDQEAQNGSVSLDNHSIGGVEQLKYFNVSQFSLFSNSVFVSG